MNLKLNNDVRSSSSMLPTKKPTSSVKEERRRTGRYIAILVGISLFLLAIYHAWVRRIPIVASLVVPALIMFVYVGWVLYSASKDKHKLLDAEAARNAVSPDSTEHDVHSCELTHTNIEISVISSKDSSKVSSPDSQKEWAEISCVLLKGENNLVMKGDEKSSCLVKPVILVNDKPPEDLDQIWTHIIDSVSNNERFKGFQTKRKFKRKFCRSKRHAVFKRSYSIA